MSPILGEFAGKLKSAAKTSFDQIITQDTKICSTLNGDTKSTETPARDQKANLCDWELWDIECDYLWITIEPELAVYYPIFVEMTGIKDKRECVRSYWRNIACKFPDKYYFQLPSTCNPEWVDNVMTDEEVLCYIKNNDLGPSVGADLKKARQHFKEYGCLHGLNYKCEDACPSQSQVSDVTYRSGGGPKKNIKTGSITDFTYVIEDIDKQNRFLQTQINQATNYDAARNQVAIYNKTQSENLTYYNNIIFWAYFVIWSFLVFILIFYSTWTLPNRIIISIVFFLFPFITSGTIYAIKYIYKYLEALIFQRVFNGNVQKYNEPPPVVLGEPKIVTPAPTTLPKCVPPTTQPFSTTTPLMTTIRP
jgi:hypothetical protein